MNEEEKTHDQWMPSPEQKEQIRTMSGLGMPQEQMAAICGVSVETFMRAKKRDNTLHDIIADGRATSSFNSRKTAYEQAMGHKRLVYGPDGKPLLNPDGSEQVQVVPPDTRMLQFWLKTREQFTERLELTGKDGEPIKTVMELSVEQRRAKIKKLTEILDLTEDKPHEEEG